ncbi:MAG TPA: 2-dehydropantoate 2-reductase [Anaeromyxobacteraceae bacterium]
MRICVVGAGAIGGLLAVKLSEAGANVTVVVRGAHLAAVRAHGMKLVMEGAEHVARLAATDRIAEAGPQDVVVLAMKAHQLAPVAADVGALLGPATAVVTAQNGIPWWYFSRHGGPHEGTRLESVDPGGVIAEHLDAARVIGSIVYPASEIAAPGVIRHIEGNRISLGELDGAETERVRALAEVFRKAGFKARVASDIRSEIWVKLWGNCTFNPLSALTHATLADICRHPATRALAESMMREAQAVGEKLGARFGVSLEKRIAGAESVGAHKTSMLQDVEAGRPLELEALVGSVIELGRITGTPTPHLTAVHACASLLAKTLAGARGRLRVEPLG